VADEGVPPGASLVAMRNGFRSIGLTEPNQIGYTEPRANSGSALEQPPAERDRRLRAAGRAAFQSRFEPLRTPS
jgi:hypothetical protein